MIALHRWVIRAVIKRREKKLERDLLDSDSFKTKESLAFLEESISQANVRQKALIAFDIGKLIPILSKMKLQILFSRLHLGTLKSEDFQQ